MTPLTVALIGAAHGAVRIHYPDYQGGRITSAVRARLHQGLDRAILLANSYAAEALTEPTDHALSRRR